MAENHFDKFDAEEKNVPPVSEGNHFDRFDQSATGAPRESAGANENQGSDSIPEDRGIVGDTVSHLARGGANLAKMVGGAMRVADLNPDDNDGFMDRAGQKLIDMGESAPKHAKIFRPDQREAQGEEGFAKRTYGMALESAPASLTPMATAAVGAGIGSFAGPVGTVVGGGLGLLGGIIGTFGMGTYNEARTTALKHLKKTRPELSKNEVTQMAHDNGMSHALYEVGTEALGDIAAMATFGMGKVFFHTAKNGVKATLKGVLAGGPKEFSKKFAKAYVTDMPFEAGSEILAYYGQSKADEKIGIGEGATGKGMLEAAGTAAWMSGILGGGISGYNAVQSRKVMKSLNSDDVVIRERAANTIAGDISRNLDDKKIAKQWRVEAQNAIASGEKIPLDEKIVDFGKEKVAEDNGTASSTQEVPPPTDRQAPPDVEQKPQGVIAKAADKAPVQADSNSGAEAPGFGAIPGNVPPEGEEQKTIFKAINAVPEETFETIVKTKGQDETTTQANQEGEDQGLQKNKGEGEAQAEIETHTLPDGRLINKLTGEIVDPPKKTIEEEYNEYSPDLPPTDNILPEGLTGKAAVDFVKAKSEGLDDQGAENYARLNNGTPKKGEQGEEKIQQNVDGVSSEPAAVKEESKTTERSAGETKRVEVVNNSKSVAHGQEVDTAPSEKQKEAENYKKGHVRLDGMDITIENPAGSTRSGTDQTGNEWSQKLKHDYGYVKGSVGYDKDHVDVFFANGYTGGAGKVHIVNQHNQDGSFDEHKVVIGARTKGAARQTYLSNYEKGWKGGKSVVEMPMDEFKQWVKGEGPSKGKLVTDGTEKTGGSTGSNGSNPDTVNNPPTQDIIEHTTKKGKVIKGIVLTDITMGEAKEIDKYTFRKDGGFFIREKHLKVEEKVLEQTSAKIDEEKPETVKSDEPDKPKANKLTPRQKEAMEWFNAGQSVGEEGMNKGVDGYKGRIRPAILKKLEEKGLIEFLGGFDEWYSVEVIERDNMRETEANLLERQQKKSKEKRKKGEQDGIRGDVEKSGNGDNGSGTAGNEGITDKDSGRTSGNGQVAQGTADQTPAEEKEEGAIRSGGAISSSEKESGNEGVSGLLKTVDNEKSAYGKNNTLVSKSRADEIRAKLKEKLNQLSSGIDPEMISLGTELAVFHIEAGARKFTDFSKAMINDLGDKIKPFLRSFYEGARYYPGLDNKGMSGAEEIESASTSDVTDKNVGDKTEKDKVDGSIGLNPDGQNVFIDKNGNRQHEDGTFLVGSSVAIDLAGNGIVVKSPQMLFERGDTQFLTVEEVAEFKNAETGQTKPESGTIEAGGKKNEPILADVQGVSEDKQSGRTGKIKDGRQTSGVREGSDGTVRGPGTDNNRTDDKGTSGKLRGQGSKSETSKDGSKGAVESRHEGVSARPVDYHITDSDSLGSGGATTKARANIKAIRILKNIQKEKRPATPEEQKALVKYVGWGSSELANGIFPVKKWSHDSRKLEPTYKKGWATMGKELETLLTKEEYADAKRSTLNAHYTSKEVIDGMYSALEQFGYKGGGRAIEPGSGVGHFVGLLPENMPDTQFTTIEMDSISAGIAEALYPNHDIRNQDYSKFKAPKNFFDFAIGNPPFDSIPVTTDKEYAKHKFALHDFFFAKTIDRVRPGGVMMLVTSRYTMDKSGDKARHYLSQRADFLGAIRLPQTAFKKNAGTDVVTDVIFLQKREEGKAKGGLPWNSLKTIKAKDKNKNTHEFSINEYFADNPEMVLGSHAAEGSMYSGNEYTVKPKQGEIGEHFSKAVQNLPKDIYEQGETVTDQEVAEIEFAPDIIKEGAFFLDAKGNVLLKEDGVGQAVSTAKGKKKALIKNFITLRDAVREVLYVQLSETGSLKAAQRNLNKAYNGFVEKHGPINKATKVTRTLNDGAESISYRYPNFQPFSMDPDSYRVAAIEIYDLETGKTKKADIFTERVISPAVEPKVESLTDALHVSMYQNGRVDIPAIAGLMDVSEQEAIDGLGDAIFHDPDGRKWVTDDEYLSGNVREKLVNAKDAAEVDKKYKRNVKALESVQPEDLPASRVTISLGMPIINKKYIEKFASEVLEMDIAVSQAPLTNDWKVVAHSGQEAATATSDYGTPRRNAAALLDHALNGKSVTVRDQDSDGKTWVNKTATETANAKLQKLKTKFTTWIWEDATRADNLLRRYNDEYNNIVKREYGGDHINVMTFPGLSSSIKPYDHQKRAAWRIIQSGNTYMAHSVGAGKTIASIIAGMEQKRLGIKKKPVWVVPNHMLKQFSSEFLETYPAAKILVADEQQFTAKNRNRFMGKVAVENWDAIIITHSAFKKIPMSAEFQAQFIEEQLDEVEIFMQEAKDEGEYAKTKQIERQKKKLQAQLEKIMSGAEKDKGVTFEETGIDQIYVDEAQEYRKLSFVTKKGDLKGIDPNGSQLAFDLYTKTQYLESQTPGRSLVLMSGTPVTNTLGEVFAIQRFLQGDKLKDLGIDYFDGWAATFGDTVTNIEATPAGTYKPVTRFAKFNNMAALSNMWAEIGDYVHAKDLHYITRPSVIGGSRNVVIGESSSIQKAYKKALGERIKTIEARSGKPEKGQDIILSVITDGRHAAMDDKYIDPAAPVREDSKMTKMLGNIEKIWRDTADNKSTQMVFADLGMPGSLEKRGFSTYLHIKEELIRSGIPENEIVFMQDYKKSDQKIKLYKDLNAGKVRIIIGSSQSMGTGVNAQKRLVALHHFDPNSYLPSNIEQREGRIVRQGNTNDKVHLYAYVTRGSYDETMWQFLETKQRFIDQFLSGKVGDDSVSDIDGASNSYAMAKAMSSDNPLILEMAGVENELNTLKSLYTGHLDSQRSLRFGKSRAQRGIESNEKLVKRIEAALKNRIPTKGDAFGMKVDGVDYSDRNKAGKAFIQRQIDMIDGKIRFNEMVKLGDIAGFGVWGTNVGMKGSYASKITVVDKESGLVVTDIAWATKPELKEASPSGIVRQLENQAQGLDRRLERVKEEIEKDYGVIKGADERIGAKFEYQDTLEEKQKRLEEIQDELEKAENDNAGLDDDSEVKLSIGEKTKAVNIPIIGEDTSDDGQRDAETLERSIKKGRKRAGKDTDRGRGHITAVNVHPKLSEGLEKIAKVFGKRVVFVKDGGSGLLNSSGYAIVSVNPDVLYINTENDYLPTTVLGHELLHHLSNDRPGLYNTFKNVLFSGNIINKEKWNEFKSDYNDRLAKIGFAPISESGIQEEYVADFLGDLVSDKTFWNQLAKENPGIFKRLAKAVIKFFDSIISKFKTTIPGAESDKFFKDMVFARKLATAVLADYAGGVNTPSDTSNPNIKHSLPKKESGGDKTFNQTLAEVAPGAVKYIKAEKPDMNFLEILFSTPEYAFKKFGAAWRVLQAQLDRRDLKNDLENDILGENYKDKDGNLIEQGEFFDKSNKLKKENVESYNKVSGYLVGADQTGDGYRIKNELEEWVVKDRQKKVVERFKISEHPEGEAEALAVESMRQHEAADLRSEGFNEEEVRLVLLSRKLTNRAFDLLIADLRKIEQEAKEAGLPTPALGEIDEAGRYGVYNGKKLIAAYESQEEAADSLSNAAKVISYAIYSKKGGAVVRGDFTQRDKAEAWAAKNDIEIREKGSFTVKSKGKYTKLEIRKRTDDELRPLTIQEAIAQMNDLRGVFFPRLREPGAYVMIAKKDGSNPIREHFDIAGLDDTKGWKATRLIKKAINSGTPAGRRIKELRSQGYDVTLKKDDSISEDVFDATRLTSSLDAILQQAMSVADKNDSDQLEMGKQINKILTLQVADIFKARGYLSTRMKRTEEVWEGYEEDMQKALVQYGRNLAAGVAKRDTAQKMILAFTGKDYSWNDYKNDVGEAADWDEYSKIVEKRRVDPGKQKVLFSQVRKFIIDVLRNDEQADRVMGFMKGLAAVKFLGFRISSAAINMTNMVQAVPATISANTDDSILKSLNRVKHAVTVYTQYRTKKGKISETDRDIFQDITSRGWDQAQYNMELASALKSKLGDRWAKFTDASMFLFGAAEKVNRATTIFAAYKAVEKQRPNMSHDDIMAEAKYISDRAHGVYGKETMPAWARGAYNPMKLAYTFQKFSHNYMLNMLEMGFSKQDWKAVSYMLLSPAILGGTGATLATPMIAAMASALGIGGDDPEEAFYSWVEETFGSDRMARHGLPGMAGVNFKGSLQMHNPMPRKLSEIGGAPQGVLTDLWKGSKHFLDGKIYKGFESMAPTAFGNMSKAVRESREGVTTGSYSSVYYGNEPLKANTLDAVVRFLSFNPSRLSGIREKQWSEKKVYKKYQERRKKINSRIKKEWLQSNGDIPDKVWGEIWKEVFRYNDLVRGSGRSDISPITARSIRNLIRRSLRAPKRERLRMAV